MALTNLWKRIHGNRLAQGSEFQIELAKPGAEVCTPLVPVVLQQQMMPTDKPSCTQLAGPFRAKLY